MRIEKHIENLIDLLKDIRKEPGPAVIGFAYSVAAVHMFMITFHKYVDPGRAVKHEDFGSKKRIELLRNMIPEFDKKDALFGYWKQMENKRNDLCYGYPSENDISEYIDKFSKIKEILEEQFGKKFEIEELEK